MAFAIRNLSVLNYAAGFTSWHYKANITTLGALQTGPAAMSEVQTDNFFGPAQDMLAPGDMIFVSAADGGCMLYVRSVQGGVTTVPMYSTGGAT